MFLLTQISVIASVGIIVIHRHHVMYVTVCRSISLDARYVRLSGLTEVYEGPMVISDRQLSTSFVEATWQKVTPQ